MWVAGTWDRQSIWSSVQAKVILKDLWNLCVEACNFIINQGRSVQRKKVLVGLRSGHQPNLKPFTAALEWLPETELDRIKRIKANIYWSPSVDTPWADKHLWEGLYPRWMMVASFSYSYKSNGVAWIKWDNSSWQAMEL